MQAWKIDVKPIMMMMMMMNDSQLARDTTTHLVYPFITNTAHGVDSNSTSAHSASSS
jgi:hypothetical protein